MNSASDSSSRITLRDIAESLGISHSTVSRALHDNPRISSPLREKIRAEADRLGYRPNPIAAALGQQRQQTPERPVHAALAWLNGWSEPARLRGLHEFDLYWRGAHRAAGQCGYRLEEFACGPLLPMPRLEKILLTRAIRGILVPPQPAIPAGWDGFGWEKFCVIRFGYSLSSPPAHVVTSDQLNNAVVAFENMHRLGYRRIGYVTGRNATTRFKAGFLMKQLDLHPAQRVPVLILPVRADHTVDYAALPDWLRESRPDAILTDLADMREVLAQTGLRVPRDIGLAAMSVMDGNSSAGIYQNSEDIGKAAMEMLISLLNHNHAGPPQVGRELLIKGRWVDGDTLPPAA